LQLAYQNHRLPVILHTGNRCAPHSLTQATLAVASSTEVFEQEHR